MKTLNKIDKINKLKKRLSQTMNSKDPHKEEKIIIIQNQITALIEEAV